MTAPNMATITASLERSLQNCSLNHHRSRGVLSAGERSSSSDDLDVGRTAASPEEENHIIMPNNNTNNNNNQNHNSNNQNSSDTTLELNSHISLPYQWEQCLDLKTGEIYYINWRNGMKAKEDPRVTQEYNGDLYSEDDEEEEDGSSYDSEESSSESSPPPGPPPSSSSRDHYRVQKKEDHVLVVAGCKSCLMYFMVPKQVEDCPKCNGQILHFDRSENGFP